MKYIINDNSKVVFIKNKTILVNNSYGNFKLKLSSDEYQKIVDIYKDNTIFSLDFYAKEFIDLLLKYEIVVSLNNIDLKYIGTRYEKLQLYFKNNFSSKKDYINTLNGKKVLFVGAGGICTEIINQLLAVGISNYILIDFDIVNQSNLNRQFVYTEKDVGKKKIKVLEKYILSKNSNAKIVCHSQYIEDYSVLNDIVKNTCPNIIICAADTPIYKIHKIVVNCSINNNIPCIFGGVGQLIGSYGPLLTKKNAKIKFMKQLNELLSAVEYLFPCRGSFGVTNTIISTYMARDIIFFLMNEHNKITSLNRKIEVNFNMNTLREKEKF